MNDFEIVFYRRASGECPVCDFLDSLNKVMRFKMMHQMDLLELYGNHPRGDYSSWTILCLPQNLAAAPLYLAIL